MAADYERIGELLEDFDQTESYHAKWVVLEALRAHAEPMARELLRLRRELTDLRDLMHTNAEYLRKDGNDIAANWNHTHVLHLNRIIQGDTE